MRRQTVSAQVVRIHLIFAATNISHTHPVGAGTQSPPDRTVNRNSRAVTLNDSGDGYGDGGFFDAIKKAA